MIPGKSVYDELPIWAQTVAVNVASASGWQRKYGRVFHVAMKELARNETLSRDEMLAEQQKALRALLRYAVAHVPFYRDRKLSPDRIEDWPIITKADIVAAPEKFCSDEFERRNLIAVRTSGTTGSPLTVWIRSEDQQMEMAFRWRHRAWASVPLFSRGAYIGGHPVVPADQMRPPFWRTDRIEKRLLCSSYHLAPQQLRYYIQALIRYRPAFVHGYPSSLYLIAQHMLEYSIQPLRPRAVFTASETLLDFQRIVIERAFGVKLFNWYGNTEMLCNIVECAAGNLHYRTDYGFLEFSENGAMVMTGLGKRAMPFIRYRIGDCATPKDGACSCGCAFPLIERVEGRIEDYVRTPDGRAVGRLDHLFKEARHVREAQILQERLDEITIRIVKTDGYTDADEQFVLREARQRLGGSIRVRFEYVNAIERTDAGKFRFIISQLPRA